MRAMQTKKTAHSSKQKTAIPTSKQKPAPSTPNSAAISNQSEAGDRPLAQGWNWPLGLALLCMAAIFWGSSRTSLPAMMFPVGHIDKLYHGIAYAILGWLLAGGFSYWLKSSYWVVWSATVVGALYGFSDELHQSFVPGRDASGGDLIADAIGAFVGAMLWWIGWRWAQRRKQN